MAKISLQPLSATAPVATDNYLVDESMTTVPVTKRKAWSTHLASAAEINTGTDATKIITPDALAGSVIGERCVALQLNETVALTTSHRAKLRVPSSMNGMNLVGVAANVGTDGSAGSSSSGAVTITVQNGTVNMLSTNLTVDEGEYDSSNAAAPAVIDTANDGVVTGDVVNVEVSGAGTGVTYTQVVCVFRLP